MANKKEEKESMPLGRKNYIVIASAVVVLIIGFLLLAGGGSDNPDQFNYEMFSTRRLVVAPILLVIGYVLIGFGIMKRFKN